MNQRAPRPTTDLFPESLSLSQKQREVLDTVASFEDGAKIQELAATLGMHINTARGHLDELLERKAIQTVTAPSKGRGRPSLVYRSRIPDNRAVASEYVTLIRILVQRLAADNAPLELAREIGLEWGQVMHKTCTPRKTPAILARRLRLMGFDPIEHEDELRLYSCPFITGDERPSRFLCAIHAGMLQALVLNTDLDVSLKPDEGPTYCAIKINSNTERHEH
ncbi:hypothetical protein LJU02_04280 [Corynebacterium pseudotuberculosis]|uniref:Uncharacterized protein n=1 Tax=Corynebacterium pseudotuberculosis 258 TaxID=1168865 RepID=A0AAU8QBL2_CORPS|nr:hypothetical protein [Corynebacterium pseudotuberculosis]AER68897.1 Hypothetical protein Cp106_0818 [Corynebacterium pseudotuberculosis 1/06-A]AEQ06391.1 hypothetical protein CPCIP5297_04360 [Corynebacterium pseudotuberculosis CIP 52.97]AFB72174.1 hypothetical protein CP316_04340 [Corynebacterium pseudotuberculosis 316]AFH90661.1 hypothetical protein CP31_04570 [Corynebacterium pseudotuberculosis 31]AFK16476.1 hypothetical protein CP258_04355 [Corynebacterium pseudotuberculosis 258]